MDKETYNCLVNVIAYLMPEEKKHWEESGKPKKHVYTSIKVVSDWIDEVAKEYTKEKRSKCVFCMSGEPHEHT